MVAVRTSPVAVLVIVIFAPGTTAPCGSCTDPAISPLFDCANVDPPDHHEKNYQGKKFLYHERFLLNIETLPPPAHPLAGSHPELFAIFRSIVYRLRQLKISFVNHSTLHHEIDMLQHGNVAERIAIHRDDIGILAGLNRADPVTPAHQIGRIHGSGLQ